LGAHDPLRSYDGTIPGGISRGARSAKYQNCDLQYEKNYRTKDVEYFYIEQHNYSIKYNRIKYSSYNKNILNTADIIKFIVFNIKR